MLRFGYREMYFEQVKMLSEFRLLMNICLLLTLVVTGAQGSLTRYPKNSVVLNGEISEFTCCSDMTKTIFWKHKHVGSKDADDIYDLNGLVNGYGESGRFRVTADIGRRCYNLIVTNVSQSDDGTYSCTDNAGFGQPVGWELIVLDSFDCQETNRKEIYVGANDIGLPQDVISMICRFKYFGNMRPRPICEWSSGAQLLDNYHHVTEINATVTFNIYIPAIKELNGDQLTCYVKIDGGSIDSHAAIAWNSSHLIINDLQGTANKPIESQTTMSGTLITIILAASAVAGIVGFIIASIGFRVYFYCRKRHPPENNQVSWSPSGSPILRRRTFIDLHPNAEESTVEERGNEDEICKASLQESVS